MLPRRWIVWFWEDDRWKRAPCAMPEGAAASYADVEHRYAGAIAMEAVDGWALAPLQANSGQQAASDGDGGMVPPEQCDA
jgi:hypothetical protein